MNKKIILLLIVLILSVESVSALQQTVGDLKANITIGDSKLLQYKVYNEDNVSVSVSFSIEGIVSNYTSFTEKIVLEPNQYKIVNLTVSIPQEYDGKKYINGTIYALKEGLSGGQVQLNIRLGKRIKVNVEGLTDASVINEVSERTFTNELIDVTSTDKPGYNKYIIVIGVLLIIVYAVIKYRNKKPKLKWGKINE